VREREKMAEREEGKREGGERGRHKET